MQALYNYIGKLYVMSAECDEPGKPAASAADFFARPCAVAVAGWFSSKAEGPSKQISLMPQQQAPEQLALISFKLLFCDTQALFVYRGNLYVMSASMMSLGEAAATAADFFARPLCGGRGRLVL